MDDQKRLTRERSNSVNYLTLPMIGQQDPVENIPVAHHELQIEEERKSSLVSSSSDGQAELSNILRLKLKG